MSPRKNWIARASEIPTPAVIPCEHVASSRLCAVFDARFYIRVRRIDESAERCGVCGRSRSQLHMAHELAGALQQARRIRQRCSVKEPHIYVRSEYIDVAKGRVSQTCNRTAVMQKLPDFVPTFSHHLKPLMRDGAQSTSMLFHPRIDGEITLDGAVESQQFGSHRRSSSRSATPNSRSARGFVLGLGTDLREHGPPLSEEFVYLSLAGEIEPEDYRFAGTLESARVFSHGILRATRWFQGATLSSYSMGSPKPSVWT